jgi:hypothetical protein
LRLEAKPNKKASQSNWLFAFLHCPQAVVLFAAMRFGLEIYPD